VRSNSRLAALRVLPKLNGFFSGILIALYVRKPFGQNAMRSINSFDQRGAARGRLISTASLPLIKGYTRHVPRGLAPWAKLAPLIRQLRDGGGTQQ